MQYYKYTVCYASGDVETIRVPRLWTPFDVNKRLCHSLVFYHLAKSQAAFCRTWDAFVNGPRVMLVNGDDLYTVDHAPTDDRDAFHLWKGVHDMHAKVG